MSLRNKTIVIGITASIACYKVLDIIASLRKKGANVQCIITKSALHLVDIKDFEKATGNFVATELFDKEVSYADYIKKNKPIRHISLADIADIFLICPATANIIGKTANGLADDLLSTSLLATSVAVLFCPAMNVKMWKHPMVQENVKKLKTHKYEFVEPEYGMLACGYEGVGRLANINRIVQRIESIAQRRNSLKGKKIVVTAGATSEEIDAVRVITNKSSGKMGTYIAEEAFLRGAEVTLIHGIHSLQPNYHIKQVPITTVSSLFHAMKKEIKNADIVIHAAAVSDFASNKHENKIKSGGSMHLELEPTTKIFEKLRALNRNMILVGFKAEYNVSEKELLERAYNLLKSAKANFVVANDVGKRGRGFDVETNEVYIVDKKKKPMHLPLSDKHVIAGRILDIIS